MVDNSVEFDWASNRLVFVPRYWALALTVPTFLFQSKPVPNFFFWVKTYANFNLFDHFLKRKTNQWVHVVVLKRPDVNLFTVEPKTNYI